MENEFNVESDGPILIPLEPTEDLSDPRIIPKQMSKQENEIS